MPVAKKLICKGSEKSSRQSFGPNVSYLYCSRALFCTDDSVLNEVLNEADTTSNLLAVPTKNARCALRHYNQSFLERLKWALV